MLLVERAGDVVTRQEIQQLTWSDNTVVDFEVGINRCIRRIRSALLDDADAPRYLETIPRIGYRFIAPVEASGKVLSPLEAPEEVLSPIADPASPAELKMPLFELSPVERSPALAPELVITPLLRKRVALGSGALCAAALVLFLLIRARIGGSGPNDLHAVPLAVSLGDQYTPTFSPDGRQVAFTWNGDAQDNFDVYVKLVNSSSQPLRLTTSKDVDYSPAWSPDGEWIAFCRGTDAGFGAVWIVPALGGAERKITDLYVPGTPWTRALSWTPDSKHLIVAAPIKAGAPLSLQSVEVSTGSRIVLTRLGAPDEDMHPAVSPDGRFVAFTRDVGRGVSRILVAPINGGAPEPISIPSASVFNARPAWTPDSRNIVFISNAGGERRVWLSRFRSSRPAEELAALGSGVQDVTISAVGQLGIVRDSENNKMYVLDVTAAEQHPATRPQRILATTRTEESPAIRPDGKQIAFASNRSGYSEIWTARIDGSDAMQVTYLGNPVTGSPNWSPDGNQIIFDSRALERPQLYLTSADGGKARPICCRASLSTVPDWSRDGQIYFSSDRTGRMEIWRVAPEGGKPIQITRFGGFGPVLSRDGKMLYYAANNAPVTSLWRQDLVSGERKQLVASVLRRAFAPASKGVYYFSGSISNQSASLYWLDEQSLHGKLLFTSDRRIGDNGVALSPDGHSLYFTQSDARGRELLLVQHFWH